MTIALALLVLAVVLSLFMTAAWAFALKTGQSGWVDTIWSLGTGVVGCVAALLPLNVAEWAAGPSVRQWLVAIFCGLWGLRLALHIGGRTHGAGDDPRYAALKVQWGDDYPRQFFIFLQIQAVAAFILDAAILLAAHAPGAIGSTDWVGVVILVGAIFGEAIADWQLSQFKRVPENRGKVCDVGLWSWSRHPNYFFEWLTWCAYPIIALGAIWSYPIGLATFLAPAQMYWLLVYVSGIPPLEAHMRKSRGEAFHAYAARVSLFWPWPPRRS